MNYVERDTLPTSIGNRNDQNDDFVEESIPNLAEDPQNQQATPLGPGQRFDQEQTDMFLSVNQVTDHINHGSQTMTRGWSGNTGPKGVLLDFKASHGKSGAILGGNAVINPSSFCSLHTIAPNASIITQRRLRSSPSSDSDSSELGEGDVANASRKISSTRTGSDLYGSSTTTTLLAPSSHHHRPRQDSDNKKSSSINGSNLSLNPKKFKLDPCNGMKIFGHLREVGVENFIQAIQAEKDDNRTVVVVHLYDPALESCVVLNNHLSNLARAHPRTKFLRALASEVDFLSASGSEGQVDGTIQVENFTIPSVMDIPMIRYKTGIENLIDEEDPFEDDDSCNSHQLQDHQQQEHSRRATDSDILPTLVWFRSGRYVQCLPALDSQLPCGGIVRGEQGCKDLELLLTRNGVINIA